MQKYLLRWLSLLLLSFATLQGAQPPLTSVALARECIHCYSRHRSVEHLLEANKETLHESIKDKADRSVVDIALFAAIAEDWYTVNLFLKKFGLSLYERGNDAAYWEKEYAYNPYYLNPWRGHTYSLAKLEYEGGINLPLSFLYENRGARTAAAMFDELKTLVDQAYLEEFYIYISCHDPNDVKDVINHKDEEGYSLGGHAVMLGGKGKNFGYRKQEMLSLLQYYNLPTDQGGGNKKGGGTYSLEELESREYKKHLYQNGYKTIGILLVVTSIVAIIYHYCQRGTRYEGPPSSEVSVSTASKEEEAEPAA